MLKKRSHGKSQTIENNSVTEWDVLQGKETISLKKMRWAIKFEARKCSSVLVVSVKLILFHSFPQSSISIHKRAMQLFVCIMKELQLDSIPILLHKYPLFSE